MTTDQPEEGIDSVQALQARRRRAARCSSVLVAPDGTEHRCERKSGHAGDHVAMVAMAWRVQPPDAPADDAECFRSTTGTAHPAP